MNDIEKLLWKQNEEFKDLLRTYGFLAQHLVESGGYDSERQRLDLLEIGRTCLEAETGHWWVSMFKDKAFAVAYQALRNWWAERKVLPRSIAALDREFQRFNDEVEAAKRDRLAGVLRPSLGSLVKSILAGGADR